MGRINKIVCVIMLSLFSGVTIAQNNTNSPYTRYGLGQLADQSFSKSKAMGGVAYGLRDNSQINPLNPASYTAMDSLTFLFEGGISFQNGNYNDGTNKINAKNSSLDYLALQFRLKKWMAVSAGVLPITNVGYNMVEVNRVENAEATNQITRMGDGGLHQFYAGIAFRPLKDLSLGVNVSYLWGTVSHNTTIYFPNAILASDRNKVRNKSTSFKGAKLDFGLQYTYALSTNQNLTFGAVFSPKMKLKNDIETVSQQNVVVIQNYSSIYDLPTSFGFGFAYSWKNKLTVAADYSQQNWSDAKQEGKTGTLEDYRKIALGAEYVPNEISRNYLRTIKYRIGMYYSDPYYKIDNTRAAREYGFSAGLGLPLPKIKSLINISAQYIRVNNRSAHFLKENYFRINLGLVFNERWFVKRKI